MKKEELKQQIKNQLKKELESIAIIYDSYADEEKENDIYEKILKVVKFDNAKIKNIEVHLFIEKEEKKYNFNLFSVNLYIERKDIYLSCWVKRSHIYFVSVGTHCIWIGIC